MDWKIQLDLAGSQGRTLPLKIASAMTTRIRQGHLQPGTRIPGARSLARSLGVSRNTVEAAYRSLRLEGWVVSDGQRGTFVNRELPTSPAHHLPKTQVASLGFALRQGSPIRIPSADPPPLCSVSTRWDFGVPDVRLAPTAELSRAIRRAFHEPRRALNYRRYQDGKGDPLIAELLKMLQATRGLLVGEENLLVTRGSQMALYLLAQVLIEPGDRVAVENPGYPGAWDAFIAAGAELVPVCVDSEGLCTDALAELLQAGPLRAVFVTPHHQFPTTVGLSARRRLELLRLARVHELVVIEDDYDHEFHYEGRPVLPLHTADAGRHVVYAGSISKVFGPGLRLGYLAAHPSVIARVRDARAVVDLEGGAWIELAMAELLEDGEIGRHLRRARRTYRERRDVLVGLLNRYLGGELSFSVPKGGMAIWANVAPHLHVERWAKRARDQGLLFRTGAPFFHEAGTHPFVRLGFAKMNEKELEDAVLRLKRAIPRR